MEDLEGNTHQRPEGATDLQKSALIWGVAALGLSIFSIVYNTAGMVLSAGILAKLFAGLVGTVTGTLGALIGDAIRKFAKPDMMFTTGGMGSLIWIKLFWMIGPQSVGLFIGTFLGIALVLK